MSKPRIILAAFESAGRWLLPAVFLTLASGCGTSYRQHVPNYRAAGGDRGPVTGLDVSLERFQIALDNFENDVENGM